MTSDLVAVVLAAGEGRRLQPLTSLLPKALCPVNNVALLDRAVANVRRSVGAVAVNVHARPDQMLAHLHHLDSAVQVSRKVHVSMEVPEPLGTAGALAQLRPWIDGRAVVVHNADAYLPGGVDSLVAGWDGERCRLLVTSSPGHGDFGDLRYVGACLLPWAVIRTLAAEPSGLYERVWRSAVLDFVVTVDAIDCGTPSDYLRANLHAAGGASVVGPDAVVEGEMVRSVVWPGGRVGPGERLFECIRAGSDLTVPAPLGTPSG